MFFVADEKSEPRVAYGPFDQIIEALAFVQGYETACGHKMPDLAIYQVREALTE